ncbi:hypothetical protein GQ53DRAFT_721917 [Thozetella sp. PMI_491]|nr:hypothetical protein GQ53DRAFT_721917 [Thozetella sp. PMI_491]
MKPLGFGVLAALLGGTLAGGAEPQIVLQQSPASAQNGYEHYSPPSLRILLAPVYPLVSPATRRTNTKEPAVPDGINVTLFLPASRFPPGVALLSLPLTNGPTPTARYDGKAISASDSRGPILLDYVDSEPSEIGEDVIRTWYPYRAPAGGEDGGGVIVRFFAPARHWALDGAPPGTHGACSFGDNDNGGVARAVGQLNSLVTTTIFAVGQLQRYPDWEDNEVDGQNSGSGRPADDDEAAFAMYWIGHQPYDMEVLPQQAEAAYRAVAGQFLSRDPFRTVHEYALLDGDFEAAWYDEGVANYYAALSLFRFASGLGGRELLLWQLNSVSQSYYTSPVVRMPWFDVLEHYWDNIHITRVPYNRGFMYMAKVNGQIRAATNGAKSVDDVAQELYRRRMAGEPHGLREWHSMVAEFIGEETEKAGYDELLAGDLIVPSPDCFSDLGVRLVRQDAEIFELGFESTSLRPTSMKINGLVEGSRAEKAGIREGDQVEDAWMAWVAADTLSGTMRATIKRGDSTGVIEWWPRSYEKVETWLWVAEDDFGEL